MKAPALAALTGLLLFLSFPKFGHGLVAFVALAPLLVALRGAGGRRAFALGHMAGMVASLGLLYWTALVVMQYGGLSLPVAGAAMVLLCAAFALFHGLFAWLVARAWRRLGPAALLLSPFAWVATEVLRAYTFFRFPWCLLGYSQQWCPPLIQVASLAGVYGVSLVVAAVSGVVAFLLVEPSRGARLRAAAALAALLAFTLGFGEWRLARRLPDAGAIRVGLVQPNIPQDDKWEPGRAMENVQRHVRLTEEAARRGARLVVWPESAVPYDYDREPVLQAEFGDLVARLNVHLLFGNDDREDGAHGRVWVGAKMLDPTGRLTLRYHKIRLVPFGEYVPLQPLLTLGGRFAAKLVRQVADFTAGDEYSLGRIDGHALAGLICYEAIFPDLAREFTSRGAGLLVNITNDAWYGTTSAPYQHMEMAAFRAVENGTYLARAANTGITAVVDPYGRIVERTELFVPAVLVRDVPIVSARTFYCRHGDVFAWGCLGLAALAALVPRRGRSQG